VSEHAYGQTPVEKKFSPERWLINGSLAEVIR
jgi:hypothetical protein